MIEYNKYKERYKKEIDNIKSNLEISSDILVYLELYIRDKSFENNVSSDFISGMKDVLEHLSSLEEINNFNKEV